MELTGLLDGAIHAAGDGGRGAVHPHGATVLSWIPDGHEDVLYVSPTATYGAGQGIRGGVPVCFPWFGPGPEGNRTPAHGPVRAEEWRVVSQHDGIVELEVDHGAEAVAAHVPDGVRVRLRASFAAQLCVALEVDNGSGEDFTFEAALHTYLRVGDVREVRVDGLEEATYLDKVDAYAERVQRGPVTITGETDRIYLRSGRLTLVDPVLRRSIVIDAVGAAETVVWNPWVDKAVEMADLPDPAWRSFLCIEAAAIRESAITLRPGERHTMEYRASVLAT